MYFKKKTHFRRKRSAEGRRRNCAVLSEKKEKHRQDSVGTICSGVINETLNGKDIVAVPLAVEDYMEIGYITHQKIVPGHFGQKYIQLLQDHVRDWTEAASAL